MRAIVTGGAGFIGSRLVNILEQIGHEVFSIDNAISEKNSGEYKYIWADICNPNNYQKILEVARGADVFFHLAAKKSVQASIDHPWSYNNTNVDGSLRMLDLCIEAGIPRFVFASTCAVYGEREKCSESSPTVPMSPYGLQKLIIEQYCDLYSRLYEIDTVSLRYFNVFGPDCDEGVIGVFKNQHKNNEPLTIFGSGEHSRDFIHVDDIASATALAGLHPHKLMGDVFNVGSGEPTSVIEIAKAISEENNFKKLPSKLEPSGSSAIISKIKKEFDWKPTISVLDWFSNLLFLYLFILINLNLFL